MRGASGLWVALLGLALGPIAGDAWNGFFDTLPEHPDDASPPVLVPVVTGEDIP